ncbi:hypothetical protein ACE7GA_21305 [Roseomonas sp. CCTCC AB2023176]|uniref:hypothetical protein n=1 Tax=Roseomonas sp. CCTCC AB2023176 TaxID=3342640 RepID=UPI0035E33116
MSDMRPTDPPRPATVEELAETVRFALTFGLTGKPHGKRTREDATLLAREIARHVLRSRFRVLKLPPAPGPDTGRLWPKAEGDPPC